jgi:DNA adenine methylase
MISPFPYVGGKFFLAREIVSRIPAHKVYVEPFFGSGRVFFTKEPSRIEVVNDRDAEVIMFFRVCQHHPEELLRCLRFTVTSRKHYTDLAATPPDSLTDILRASRFLYLQKVGFGGLIQGRHYTHWTRKAPPFKAENLPDLIRAVHARFNGVQIECLDYLEIVEKFDAPDAFFYLDPPYFGTSSYKFNFQEKDFQSLARALRSIRGRFLLSLNDVPEVRKIFAPFVVHQVFTQHSSKRGTQRRTAELLISNYRQVPAG